MGKLIRMYGAFVIASLIVVALFSVKPVSVQAVQARVEETYNTGSGTKITVVITVEETGRSRWYQGIDYIMYWVGETAGFSISVSVEKFGDKVDRIYDCQIHASILQGLGFKPKSGAVVELTHTTQTYLTEFSYFLDSKYFTELNSGGWYTVSVFYALQLKEGVQWGSDESYKLDWASSVSFGIYKPIQPELSLDYSIGHPVILGKIISYDLEIRNAGDLPASGIYIQVTEYYFDSKRTVENNPIYVGSILGEDSVFRELSWYPEESGAVELTIKITSDNAGSITEKWRGFVELPVTETTSETSTTEIGIVPPGLVTTESLETTSEVVTVTEKETVTEETEPSFIPGFTTILALLALPAIAWLRNKRKGA